MASHRLFPACLLLLSAACGSKAPSTEPSTQAAYVNAAVCATCHREISETYRRTGMGRSFARAGREPFAEARFFHRASDRHYAVYRKDGRLFQRRHQLAAAGAEINVVEKEMHYVIGSGNHSRTYLTRKPDGRLAELPLSWYSEGKGLWAMSPGYDRPDQEDFRRDINYQCMFCHNGYPNVAAGADSSGTAPIFPAELPEGIDCQRCHGPGGAHVAAMQSGKKDQTAIVNPARLSPERQMDLCMQCHLETTSFRLPGAIVRYDRPLFSYRPGEPLGDYALHFDHAPNSGREDKFEIAHAAYRLRQSSCFLKSGGKMVCTTCHNPHDTAAAKPACLGCHPDAARHDTPRGCAGCHMPKRRTEDVVHVVMTDHLIQRRIPARDLLRPHDPCESVSDRYRCRQHCEPGDATRSHRARGTAGG